MRRLFLLSVLVLLATLAIPTQSADAGPGDGLTRDCDHYTVIYRTANECLKGKCRYCVVYLHGEPYSTMGPHCEWVECGIEQRVSLPPLTGIPGVVDAVRISSLRALHSCAATGT